MDNMNDLCILINTVDKAKDFVNKISTVQCDVDVMVGRYVIDAKSILGIFSVDISKPLRMKIHAVTEDEYNEAFDKIEDYVIAKF